MRGFWGWGWIAEGKLEKGLSLPFVSSIFKGIVVCIKDMESEIPDTKCKEIYCEVCRQNIKKLGWAKHLKTKKHIENENGVEEVAKKQCRKCGCWRVLELYRGENATCNVCLGYRESWAKKNEEKVRDMNKNYWDEHREEKKAYNKDYSKLEIECEVCECKVRKCNWAKHVGSKKHILGGGGGKVDDDVGGGGGRVDDDVGARGGWYEG